MRISRKFYAGIGFLMAVVIVSWYLLHAVDYIGESKLASKLPDELKPYAKDFELVEKLSREDPVLAQEKTRELIAKLPEGSAQRWMNLALNSGIEEIDFYGKTIDQNGNPIAGAKIGYEAVGKFYAAGSGRGYVISDGSGNFQISARGSSLKIWSIKHPDAMFVRMNVPGAYHGSNDMYPLGNSFFSFDQSDNYSSYLWTDTSPQKPFLFDMWMIDKEEAASNAINISWAAGTIRIAHDGSPYTVKLEIEKRSLKYRLGEGGDGDFIVKCERRTMQEHTDRSDWSVTIEPISGGIQVASDRYLNYAPEAGYLPSLTYSQKLGDEFFWEEVPGQRYYFYAHNEKTYGALLVYYRPFNLPNQLKTGELVPQFCQITFEYKVNRAGSRYLFKDRGLLAKQ